jgi:L-malate glycosyltransferase
MKILEIASGLDLNGATTHCLLLAHELADRGHETVFLCRPKSWISEHAVAEGFDVIESDLHRWPADELRRVSTMMQARGIDLVHTHMSRAHFFGVLLRWMSGVPCVATAHSCRVQFHWMFNDLVIAVSEKTRRFHESYNLVQPHRIRTIHNFIDDRHVSRLSDEERREVRQSFGVDDEEMLVATIGTVHPKKGQLNLIRALPRLLEQAPNTRLLVVGSLDSTTHVTEVKAEAERLGVESHVIWAGQRDDIAHILPACDVSVLASLEENFPLVILEAMAASVPVVATDVGGVAECVVPGETGLLVPPNDSDALAKALGSLIGSPQDRIAMGEAGRRRLLRSFSSHSQVRCIEEAFSSVVFDRQAHARAA